MSRTGCELAAENPLTDWLAQAGVSPHDVTHYETRQVWDAVIAGTGGARPHIDCKKVEEEVFISEVEINILTRAAYFDYFFRSKFATVRI